MRVVRCALLGALLLTACSPRVSGGQQAGSRDDPGDPGAIGRELTPRVNPDTSVEDQQEKLLRIQRQKRIISDSDKLLKLATDLKQQIDNPAPGTLSADSVKKAAEIEKLAHSLEQRLSGKRY